MKRCPSCDTYKELSLFSRDNRRRDGLFYICKDCKAAKDRGRPRRSHWANQIWLRYRITQSQYEELLRSQGGVCAICGKFPEGTRLCVDHDHRCCPRETSCGSCVRSLLCRKCNLVIGNANDSFEVLANAAEYVKRRDREAGN